VLVFLGLIVPSLIISLVATSQGTIGFGLLAASTMGRDLGLVALIVFFVWRNGERLREFGLRKQRIWTEIALGMLLFAPFFFALRWIERLFIDIGLSVPPESNPIAIPSPILGEVLLGTMLVVVVAFSEELIFRGYLIHRFRGAGASTTVAVIVSTAIFALGHGYEGTAGLATVSIMGLIFALVYLWRRGLTTAMTLHFLQDFVVIVLLPLLQSR
jgi:membrane protease YdiL (CAAX protease family)